MDVLDISNEAHTAALGWLFAYRIRSTGFSSARYGPCEVCKLHCSEVFIFTESRGYLNPETGMMGYTYHGAQSQIFGHRACVLAKQKEVYVVKTFENTKAALKVYDEGKAERKANWVDAKTNADVSAAEAADKEALLIVQTAFHEDTQLNAFENRTFIDIEYIRYVATGKPSPGAVSIGNVGFGKLTGKTARNGNPEWVDTHHIGDERVALLQTVLDGEALPEGLILVGRLGSPWVQIPAEAVNWETSGLRPSISSLT